MNCKQNLKAIKLKQKNVKIKHKKLYAEKQITSSFVIEKAVQEEFYFSPDIIDRIKQDEIVWKNYQGFSESYKRIRIGYIEAARKRAEEFEKRLSNFINKTREHKMISGYGGIDKYY